MRTDPIDPADMADWRNWRAWQRPGESENTARRRKRAYFGKHRTSDGVDQQAMESELNRFRSARDS